MTGKFKGTPGPWNVFRTPDGQVILAIGDINAEGVVDCGFGLWRSGEEKSANAQAISATPDFIAAAGPLVSALDPTAMDNELVEVRAGDIKALAAALNKAIGA